MPDELNPANDTSGSVATEPEPAAPESSIAIDKSAPSEPALVVNGESKGELKLPASIGKSPVKPTGRFEKRISQLAAEKNAAIAEAASLRQQMSQLQTMNRPGEKTAKAAISPAGNAELHPEDFETYGEYVQALAEKVWEEKETAKQSRQAEESYKTYQAKKQAEFQTHSEALAQQYGEGYWDAITDENLPVSEAMADAVIELDELGPLTMLYLAAHKMEAAIISKMNPRAATIAIGRIAAKLDQDIKAGNVTQTTFQPEVDNQNDQPFGAKPTGQPNLTPRPVPTIRGSSPSLQGAPSDKDDVQTWLRKETERMRKIYPHGRFYGA